MSSVDHLYAEANVLKVREYSELQSIMLSPVRPEEDLSSGKSESTHPSRTVVKSIEVFYGVESVVRGNADSLLN